MVAHLWFRHHLGKILRAEVVFTDLPWPSYTWTAYDFRSDSLNCINGDMWLHALNDAQAQADAAVMRLHDCDDTCEPDWYRVA